MLATRGELECAEALCKQMPPNLDAESADGAQAIENAVEQLVKTHRKYLEKLRAYHDALVLRERAASRLPQG
jgi:hypothetical protein